jgi:hypothetical protein
MLLIFNYINFNLKLQADPNYFARASLLQLELFCTTKCQSTKQFKCRSTPQITKYFRNHQEPSTEIVSKIDWNIFLDLGLGFVICGRNHCECVNIVLIYSGCMEEIWEP